MSARFFVDTNILLYAHEPDAGLKHERALKLVQGLWANREGAVSTQVLQEFAFNLYRKTRLSLSRYDVGLRVTLYSRWELVVNTPASILRALAIQESNAISFWDSLILQAAEFCRAEIVYSEDLAHGSRYGTVQVVNPLI